MNAPKKSPRRRVYQRWVLRARRLHLYVGLFLLPWVILYGSTAILFNHPGWFHKRSVQTFDDAVLDETPLRTPPAAAEMAALVHAHLPGALSKPDNIRWVGSYRLEGRDDSGRYTAFTDAGGRGVTLYFTPQDAPPAHPLTEVNEITVSFPMQKDEQMPSLAQAMSAPQMKLTRAPTLTFDVTDGEARWRVEYNPLNNSLEAESLDIRSTTQTTRSFLTRLHTLHVFPAAYSARWIWALLVDVMGGAMILWALTGLMMWWQLKKLRRIGAAALGAALITMVTLAINLFIALGY